MSEEPDPAAVLAELSALVRSRYRLLSEALPDSFIARMRECERLATETQYPQMAAIMLKLAGLWREAAGVGVDLAPSETAAPRA